MANKKSVSVIISAYNGEKQIESAIKRVLSQDYTGKIEIIVADDGSKDNTAKIVRKFKNVRLVGDGINRGLAVNLNSGMKAAKNEIIIFMHQDLKPIRNDWISSLISPFDDPEVICVTSSVVIPRKIWEKFEFWHKVFTVKELKGVNYSIGGSNGMAYKRDFLIKVGGYNETNFATAGEDCDLRYRIKDMGKMVNLKTLIHHLEGSHRSSLKKQFKKSFQYAEAHGVLTRMHGRKNAGLKVMALRTILFASLLIPFVNIFGLLALLVFSSASLVHIIPEIKDKRLFLFPFVNLIRNFYYLVGFWKGFILGKQSWRWNA